MVDTYWATLPPEKLCAEVLSRWKDWRRHFWETGIGAKADKGRRYMYGMNDAAEHSSRLQVGGKDNQYVKRVLNKVRPVVQRSLAMIASQTGTMVPVAANSDAEAREQAISARGILEHVHREQDTESLDKEVLEIAMCMGEGGRLILWDANAGEPEAMDEDTGSPAAHAGDFYNVALTPFDMAQDVTWRSRRRLPWRIARTWESKWELAATYPDKAEEILAVSSGPSAAEDIFDMRSMLARAGIVESGDAIPVYRFFHVDSRAVPGGRVFVCLDEGTWLTDGANPYNGLPVEVCSAAQIIGTSMGYSNIFDALGISDALNALETVVTSHTTRWGTRPLVDFQGSGLQHSTLGNGTTVLTVKGPEFMPQPLDVPPIPPEVFKHAEKLAQDIEEALGMNPTAMGNPPFAGMPAQLAALLDQKAHEFNDGLSSSFRTYRQACATRELQILKKFADEPRMAVIQGKAKAWMLKSFSKDDLTKVSRVAMEPAPSGTGTMAFKMAQAEMLRAFGVELPPEQIIELLRTGQYESAFEHDEANRLRIKSENEMLQEGQMPPVLLPRTHWLDIPEHLALLNSPDMATKPEVVDAVLSTVEAKLAAWRAMPLDILQLLGGPPPPQGGAPAAAMTPPLIPQEGSPDDDSSPQPDTTAPAAEPQLGPFPA